MKKLNLLFRLGTGFALTLVGCTASLATLNSDGLKYDNNSISVQYTDKVNSRFINDFWQVENWTFSTEFKKWNRKNGDKYKGIVKRDLDEDGTSEQVSSYYTELELRHVSNDAQIFVDLTILPKTKRNTHVEVFLSYFAENLSGQISWHREFNHERLLNEGRTYASKIITQRRAKIGGNDAIVATIELANLDQLKLDSSHRSMLVSVAMIKIDKVVDNTNGISKTRPAILSVVLQSRPDVHEECYQDYEYFLQQIKIDGASLEYLNASKVETQPVSDSKLVEESVKEEEITLENLATEKVETPEENSSELAPTPDSTMDSAK